MDLAREAVSLPEYLEMKHLSRDTLDQMPVEYATDRFEYLFIRDGEEIGRKVRKFPKTFSAKTGSKFCLWNLDAIKDSKRVIITEGEDDALALVEAGINPREVCSIPSGANDKPASDPFERYKNIVADLSAARTIYIWMDDDVPGRVTRGDLVQALGAARCKHVTGPEKDAGDVLRLHGKQAVRDALNSAEDVPISGLYRLNDLPEPPPREVWDSGIPEWEGKVKLGRGLFSVVTGHPNHGKSVLMMQLLTNMARNHNVQPVICTLENQAKPDHRRIMRSFYSGKLEKDMTPSERKEADEFINDNFQWIVLPRSQAGIDRVLDIAEGAIIRGGSQILQIDPFNRLESQRPAKMSEHDYIGRVLDTLCDFAQDMRCHTQIVAHPKKMDRQGAANLPAPHLDDISGSKHWDNKSDQGFVIHRPNIWLDGVMQTDCKVIVRKVRYPDLGKPCVLDMDYDLQTGLYKSTDYQTGPV
jgi:twinkle protein